jgi:hypothetical protein
LTTRIIKITNGIEPNAKAARKSEPLYANRQDSAAIASTPPRQIKEDPSHHAILIGFGKKLGFSSAIEEYYRYIRENFDTSEKAFKQRFSF